MKRIIKFKAKRLDNGELVNNHPTKDIKVVI